MSKADTKYISAKKLSMENSHYGKTKIGAKQRLIENITFARCKYKIRKKSRIINKVL